MRYVTTGLCILALAGCSAPPSSDGGESEQVTTADVAAPGIAVTATPGVAFNYRYAFRLPAARIAAAQETHAKACETLGIARCRITGMRYTLTGDDRIDAMLAFRLDPALARVFGRQGIAAIEAAEGMLTNAEITGTDAGGEIERLAGERARVAADRARLDRELARKDLSADIRAEMLRQRGTLDEQTRGVAASTAEQQASLATTPMTFDYRSGTAIRGFDARSPFLQAADTALVSIQWTLAIALGALATFGPPLLLAALLFLLWRRFGAPLIARRSGKPVPVAD